jgi:uncharacterized membrane protein
MIVDWNVRFGDILIVLSLVGTCLLFAFRSGQVAKSIEVMQKEISELKEVTKSLAAILTQQAVVSVRLDAHADRLNMLDKRIEDIKRAE